MSGGPGRTSNAIFKARAANPQHTKRITEYILKTLIKYGNPIIAADLYNTLFERAKPSYEVICKELSEAGLPSPKILAIILLNYFQTGEGTYYRQICEAGYSYNYVKNRLPYLMRLGFIEKMKSRPRFYYPNVSLLMMKLSNQWSFGNFDNFKRKFYEFMEQLRVEEGHIGLHNIHLSFYALGVYRYLTIDMEKCGWRLAYSNKEFITPEIPFGPDRRIKAIFEANGRVRVIIACSDNPIVVPNEIMYDFVELLIVFWKFLKRNLEAFMHMRFDPVTLPRPYTWIINSVEVNVDFDSYDQHIIGPLKLFERLSKLYTKKFKNGRKALRVENLLKPNVTVGEFIGIVGDFLIYSSK
ncbi:MAG: hypothetical protein QW692_00750 [Nitrososphaerota archaeon]